MDSSLLVSQTTFPVPTYLRSDWIKTRKKILYLNIIHSMKFRIYLNIFRGKVNFHEITITLALSISKIRRSKSTFYKFRPNLTLTASMTLLFLKHLTWNLIELKPFGLFRLYHGCIMDILTICFIYLFLYATMNGKMLLLEETFVPCKSCSN